MPLYEFTCPECGETRERLGRSAEAIPTPRCAACGGEMTRQWSPVAEVGSRSDGCPAPAGSGFT